MTRTLDLGCGQNPRNPFSADDVYGVDIRDSADGRIRNADLVISPIPFESEFFDYVTAFDFIEHVPRLLYLPQRRLPFVELLNEVYRVLKVGGTFLSVTPAQPHGAAFIDPTHVNFITEGTFPLYFGDADQSSPWALIYGFCGAFRVISEEWRGPHLQTILQKIDFVECPSYRNGHSDIPERLRR